MDEKKWREEEKGNKGKRGRRKRFDRSYSFNFNQKENGWPLARRKLEAAKNVVKERERGGYKLETLKCDFNQLRRWFQARLVSLQSSPHGLSCGTINLTILLSTREIECYKISIFQLFKPTI